MTEWLNWTNDWRRLLKVPWTAGRSNQSILKEISPECSLKGLMLKLKLWYFGHLLWRADSLEKTLMLGKNWGQEKKGMRENEMVGWNHWLNGHELDKLQELVMDREAWCAAVHKVAKSRTQLSDWTELNRTDLQHARLPSPSLSPGVYSNSCLLSQWCHPKHLIFCCPLHLFPSIFPSVRTFSNESALHIRWPKCWSFSPPVNIQD